MASTKDIKTYFKICKNAKEKNRNRNNNYYENHHIQPKSLGGSNNKSNLVLLTAREHYLVHFLLYKHYKSINEKNGMIKMGHAFHRMMHGNIKQDKKFNSHQYEIASKINAKCSRDRRIGKKHSEETKKKISESNKGKCSHPISKETRKKLSEATKGKTYEEIYGEEKAKELRKFRSEHQKKVGGYGPKKHSEETKKKMSKAHKGKKHKLTKFYFCKYCDRKIGGLSNLNRHEKSCKENKNDK